MGTIEECNNISQEKSIEDYASAIISRVETLIRIFELLQDEDEGKHWLDTGIFLSKSVYDYASKISEIMVTLPNMQQ